MRWQGSPEAGLGVARGFQHGSMKNVSLKFSHPTWEDWHGITQPIPEELQTVAATFADLQDERHTADYNNHEEWAWKEVMVMLMNVTNAFGAWAYIRTHPMAGNYLLAMLLPKHR